MSSLPVLPCEVVSHLLQFLPIPDWKVASLVSRIWWSASRHPTLLKNIVFNLNDCDEDRLQRLNDGFKNIKIESFSKPLGSLWENSFGKVTLISFQNSSILPATLFSIISRCPQLRSLNLSGCDSLLMTSQFLKKGDDCLIQSLRSSLALVTSLDLSYMRHLSDASFQRLVELMPSIRTLSLAGCKINFELKYAASSSTTQSAVKECVFSFPVVCNFLKDRVNLIEDFDFCGTGITDDALKQIAMIRGSSDETESRMKLKRLKLKCCKNISDRGIRWLCDSLVGIEELNLDTVELTDSSLASISVHSLRRLNLAKCQSLTPRGLEALSRCPNLSELNLASCWRLTGDAILDCVSLANIVYLDLMGCSLLTDCDMVQILKTIPNSQLRHLNLSSTNIGDTSVAALSFFQPRVAWLSLSWCKNVTDDGILGFVPGKLHPPSSMTTVPRCRCSQAESPTNADRDHLHFPSYQHSIKFPKRETRGSTSNQVESKGTDCSVSSLSLKEMAKLDQGESDVNQDRGDYALRRLTSLSYLDLTDCLQLSDISILGVSFFEQSGIKFSSLRHLSMSLCAKLTSKGVSALGKCNPSLESVSLSHCGLVTNLGLIPMLTRIPRLRQLDVGHCDSLTSKVLDQLIVSNPLLRTLDVSGCGNLTSSQVEMFESRMPYLQSVKKNFIGE